MNCCQKECKRRESLITLRDMDEFFRDGLASTILTKCDPHWGAFFHYEQDRSFTVREAARLQSFPDHFVFTGNLAEQFAQVGNAVPPLLAQAVGLSLRSILETED